MRCNLNLFNFIKMEL